MGRAIEMEKDIDAIFIRIEKLENIVRGMTHKLDEAEEKSSKTTHIDLTEVKNDKEEKTNDEGSGESNKSDDKNVRKPKRKTK
jgi:hypothetical protein